MCHASGSQGSQPHNIQAYRLVLKLLQMKGCVKHHNMQTLVKLPHHYSQVVPSFRVRHHKTTLTVAYWQQIEGAQIT